MQTIRVAEHLDRTEKVERPDWWHSNDKNTTRAPRDGTRMSIGTCSAMSGLPGHGYRKNGLRYERRRFIINRVWQHPSDCLIQTLPSAFDRTDIINACSRTVSTFTADSASCRT